MKKVIKNEVEIRTKEYRKVIENKDKVIADKEKQMEALKEKIAKIQSQMDNDSINSGIPTSRTGIGKNKYIPNTREKIGKSKGAPKGHSKYKLKPFKEEVTETIEIVPTECNKCHSKNIERLETSVDKQELDYEVVLIKRKNKFMNYRCRELIMNSMQIYLII